MPSTDKKQNRLQKSLALIFDLHSSDRFYFHLCQLLGFGVLQLLRSRHIPGIRPHDSGDPAHCSGLQ